LTVLAALGVLIVIFVAAVVATREGGELGDAPGDVADVGLPGGPLQPEDVHAVRFGVTVRGYRMSEVDEVLERVARELADRDERIALLVAAAESGPNVAPAALASPASAPAGAASVATPASSPGAPPPASAATPAGADSAATQANAANAATPANAAPSTGSSPSAIDLSTDLTPLAVRPTAVQTAPAVQTAAPVPAAPVVPTEPPLDGPPATLQVAPEPTPSEPEAPPVKVATIPVELAPLPDRSGDEEPAARD